MITGIRQVALLVRDYDEALDFYSGKLGFVIMEDSPHPSGKRWIRLRPPGGQGTEILLSRAAGAEQSRAVGNQAGGRVLLFLESDDFDADYDSFRARGVEFTEEPRDESFGRVGIFKDLYGNRIELIGPRK